MKITKGQGTVLIVFVGFLGAFVPAFTAYAQIGVLPDLFEQRTNDLPALARTESRAETTAQQFIPLAGKYSSAQAAKGLSDVLQTGSSAGNCLRTQVTNRFVPVRGDPDTAGADEFRNSNSLAADLIECAGKQTGRNLQQMYVQDLVYSQCDVKMNPVETSTDVSEAEVTIETENNEGLVVAECVDRGIETRYETDTSQVTIKAPPNSFTALAQATQTLNVEMEQVVHQIEKNDNHYGTVTGSAACRDKTRANRRSKAEDDSLDKADEKLEAIGTAVVKQGHGIGSGSKRGAEHIFNEETGQTGFDLFDGIIDFFTDRLDGKKFQDDVDGDTEVKSSSASNCGCIEFKCSNDDFSYSGGGVNNRFGFCRSNSYGSCKFIGSPPSPDAECDPGEIREGNSCIETGGDPCPSGYTVDPDDNRCLKVIPPSQGGGIDTTPISCSSGSWDSSDDRCESYAGSVDYSCSLKDGVSFTYSGGSCVPSNPPSPTCTDDCYSGSATANYTAEDLSADIKLVNDESQIPTESGWINLGMDWTYERVFESPP